MDKMFDLEVVRAPNDELFQIVLCPKCRYYVDPTRMLWKGSMLITDVVHCYACNNIMATMRSLQHTVSRPGLYVLQGHTNEGGPKYRHEDEFIELKKCSSCGYMVGAHQFSGDVCDFCS